MRDLEHRTKAQVTATAALFLCISPSSTAASALAARCRWPLAQQRRAWADTAPRRTDIPRTCTDILRTSYGHPTWTPHGQGSGHPTDTLRTPYGHPTDRGRTPHGQGSGHHGHEGTTPLWTQTRAARIAPRARDIQYPRILFNARGKRSSSDNARCYMCISPKCAPAHMPLGTCSLSLTEVLR